MSIKLFKYDLKWLFQAMIPPCGLSVIGAIIYCLLTLLPASSLISGAASLLMVASVLCASASMLYVILKSWQRLEHQMFLDEAHLARTLPVTSSQIFFSILIASLTVLLASVVILCLVIWMLSYGAQQLSGKEQILAKLLSSLDEPVLWAMVTLIYGQLSFVLMSGYTGLVISYQTGKKTTAAAVVAGVIVYYVYQIIFVLGFFIFANDLFTMSDAELNELSVIRRVLWSLSWVYPLGDVLCFLYLRHAVKKGIDVR